MSYLNIARAQIKEIKRRSLEVEIEQLRGLVREQAGDLDIQSRRIKELENRIEELSKEHGSRTAEALLAEKDAYELRAWRRGLVKPGTEEPDKTSCYIVVETEDNSIELDLFLGKMRRNVVRWFRARDIFEAADQDTEKENKE